MRQMRYLLDANVFIQAKRPRSICCDENMSDWF